MPSGHLFPQNPPGPPAAHHLTLSTLSPYPIHLINNMVSDAARSPRQVKTDFALGAFPGQEPTTSFPELREHPSQGLTDDWLRHLTSLDLRKVRMGLTVLLNSSFSYEAICQHLQTSHGLSTSSEHAILQFWVLEPLSTGSREIENTCHQPNPNPSFFLFY